MNDQLKHSWNVVVDATNEFYSSMKAYIDNVAGVMMEIYKCNGSPYGDSIEDMFIWFADQLSGKVGVNDGQSVVPEEQSVGKKDKNFITDLVVENIPEDKESTLLDSLMDAIIGVVEKFGLHCGGSVKFKEIDDEEE